MATPQQLESMKRELLTASQRAGLPLDLDEDAIYRYARAGTIPYFMNDIHGHVDPKQVAKWLRNLLSSARLRSI